MFAVLPQKANNFFIDLLTKVIDDNMNTIFKNNPKIDEQFKNNGCNSCNYLKIYLAYIKIHFIY